MFVVGVDGCRGGWLAVRLNRDQSWKIDIFRDFAELWRHHQDAALILVDIPIGLPDNANDRTCDRAARAVLGPRRASVFPVPCRAAVYAPDYDAAIKINEKITGKSIFRATWNLIPRMRQVDEILQAHPQAKGVTREAHPEVLFWGLNQGRPMACRKKDAPGEAERLEVLQNVYPRAERVFRQAGEILRGRPASPDDLLDALAAAVTALVGKDRLATLPPSPPQDSRGLPMEMVYYLPSASS